MKGMIYMARDQKIPVTFTLPDGDVVSLITWEFVLNKLQQNLNPTVTKLGEINNHLKQIDDRLAEMIEEQQ